MAYHVNVRTSITQPTSVHRILNTHVAQSDAGDAGSMISSRMTDIMPDDERGVPSEIGRVSRKGRSTRRSLQRANSRPGTGISQRSIRFQAPASRRALSTSHASRQGSLSSSRPPSSASRTHVPSLTSHAFFRPMSSQRLQAQRGGPRPATNTNNQGSGSRNGPLSGHSAAARRDSIMSECALSGNPETLEEISLQRTLSRGTEMADPDLTSPQNVNVHRIRRLPENEKPSLIHHGDLPKIDYVAHTNPKNIASVNPPVINSHTFRTPFNLSSRVPGAGNHNSDRSAHGREKLSSNASSPGKVCQNTFRKPQDLGRNWEYFPGNTVFWARGRLQNTRHRPINIATGSFVVVPSTLFFFFSAPWLWHNISPAIPIAFGYMTYLCLSSFFHASFSNPGILPRNLHLMPPPDENEDPLRLAPPMNDWTMVKSTQSDTAAMEVPIKYCKTCNIWRPPRGHHCRICDSCIETQDHHCVWLNNCVGRRNYRYFFTFVTTCFMLGLFLSGASLTQIIVHMNMEEVTFAKAIKQFKIPFVMIIYGLIAFPYPAALTGYHLFLMGRGETTREYLNSHKFLKKDRHRPFNQGNFIKNWIVVLCRPRPPTYLSFKEKYELGDQRFGQIRGRKKALSLTKDQNSVGASMEMHNVSAYTPTTTSFQGNHAIRQ
ncbi:unnamed protein product [Blumeria hordei]|uniref:Palmitoyltransferase n=1 Tax=Blumeria hordei TaxID=2867405 RepID=A0A383UY02_BLUHO|nr:unnamed protein product [Blumeria hordei]